VTWGRQDDSFYDHIKVRRMPKDIRNAACGLYWRAVSLCNRHLTDGWLTDEDIELVDGKVEEVEALVATHLFDRRARGLRIHDFLDFNKSRAQVLSERETKAQAGRLGGIASGKRRRSKREAPASPLVELPSRPVPSQPASNEAGPPSPPDVVEAYYLLTARIPKKGAIDWLERLVQEHGASEVERTMAAVWPLKADPSSFLGDVEAELVLSSRKAEREAEEARARADAEYERREKERRENASPEERARAAAVKEQIRSFVGGLPK
jgi:ElaB/YqjD/DUF883 family membrane-anchored ribosome-binding protein